jgi:ABC-2 type transport system ATP-binding protein
VVNACKIAEIHEVIEKLTKGYNTEIGEHGVGLSGGQKQRLAIALALVGNPRVAILDELTTGLDPQARRSTWALIRRIRDRGVTVLLVSHFMDEIHALCDRVAVMNHGRIVAIDTPARLVEESGAERSMRFTLPTDIAVGALAGLGSIAGVSDVARVGDDLIIRGRGDFAATVASVLSQEGIRITHLRVEEATLDDAFADLTGERLAP